MAVFKQTGSKQNPKYVRDPEQSTSDNPYGTEKAFLAAKAAEQELEQKSKKQESKE